MNTRLALYIAGTAYLVRVNTRRGRRVAILDRTRRWRSAARAMRAAGHSDCHIALALGCSRAALKRTLAFDWRF